jgi:hypothetical protein
MCLPTQTDTLDINLATEQQKIRVSLVGQNSIYAYLPQLFHFTATLRIYLFSNKSLFYIVHVYLPFVLYLS